MGTSGAMNGTVAGETAHEEPGVDASEPHRPGLAMAIVLAGGLKPSPLVHESGLSTLDLHLTPTRTLLHLWLEQIAVARGDGQGETDVRVVHGPNFPMTQGCDAPGGLRLHLEHEQKPFRGPAGVAKDAFSLRPADGTVLIAEAGRWLGVRLESMVREHSERLADVTVGVNPDGSPAGVYLVEPGALGLVHDEGFMDLKEQWLRRVVDSGKRVLVYRMPVPGTGALWSRRDLIAAAVRIHRGDGGGDLCETEGVLRRSGETEVAGFAVVAPGAKVAPSAHIHESIIMPGAEIGERAVVVRCLVCPGGIVETGTDVVDAVVARHGFIAAGSGKKQRLWDSRP